MDAVDYAEIMASTLEHCIEQAERCAGRYPVKSSRNPSFNARMSFLLLSDAQDWLCRLAGTLA